MNTEIYEPLSLDVVRTFMPSNKKNDAIKKLNDSITLAAKNDKTSVRIDWLCDIVKDSCTLSELGKIVVAEYEKLGYKVQDIYDCGQFVDIGMALTWE